MKNFYEGTEKKKKFGISYVKRITNSEQRKETRFGSLMPIIIQASKNSKILNELISLFSKQIEKEFYEREDENWGLIYVKNIKSELDYKKNLCVTSLKKNLNFFKNHFWFQTLNDIQDFFEDNYIIHIYFRITNDKDQPLIISAIVPDDEKLSEIELIEEVVSNNVFKITIYGKKGLNSKKSFLKSVPFNLSKQFQEKFFVMKKRGRGKEKNGIIEYNPSPLITYGIQHQEYRSNLNSDNISEEYLKELTKMENGNLNTLGFKLEGFVDENFWKNLSTRKQNELYTYIFVFKLKIEEFLFYKSQEFFFLKRNQKILSHNILKLENSFINNRSDMNVSLESHTIEVKNQIIEYKKQLQTITNEFYDKFNDRMDSLYDLPDNLQDQITDIYEGHVSGQKYLLPTCLVNSRDCFLFDLEIDTEEILYKNKKIIKKTFYFSSDDVPINFNSYSEKWKNNEIGIVIYEGIFSEEELKKIEALSDQIEENNHPKSSPKLNKKKYIRSRKSKYNLDILGKRDSNYFESDINSSKENKCFDDINNIVSSLNLNLIDPLQKTNIINENSINSIGISFLHNKMKEEEKYNIFNDSQKNQQSIYSLRLFSNSRISFGSSFYSFCQGIFSIEIPRGSICQMISDGYAMNEIKHFIRPQDIKDKSVSFVLKSDSNQISRSNTKSFWDYFISLVPPKKNENKSKNSFSNERSHYNKKEYHQENNINETKHQEYKFPQKDLNQKPKFENYIKNDYHDFRNNHYQHYLPPKDYYPEPNRYSNRNFDYVQNNNCFNFNYRVNDFNFLKKIKSSTQEEFYSHEFKKLKLQKMIEREKQIILKLELQKIEAQRQYWLTKQKYLHYKSLKNNEQFK